MAELGLCCCMHRLSLVGGLLFIVVLRVLIAVASRGGVSGGHRLQGMQASAVVAHALSCSAACGIFLDQGLNTCPLHWWADS